MNDTERLLRHLEDLAQRATQTGSAHSKFLTPSQAFVAQTHFKNRRDILFGLDGGFLPAERSLAVFTQPDWGVFVREEALAALAISHRQQDTLRHQDILGATLGLGLGREAVGDIVVLPGRASLVCLAPMAAFLCSELQTVGRTGVKTEQIPLENLPEPAATLEERTASVASLRLDAVLAAAFCCSRSEAGQAIRAGRVQLAHRQCLELSKTVQEGDIFSLQGKGRAKLLATEGLSRKGRLRIVLGLYTGI